MLLNRSRLPQKKRKRGRPRSKSAPASISLPLVRKTRKKWTNESMVSALDAVKSGTPVLRAAAMYNIPRQTLYDRVNGRVTHGCLPGPDPYLSTHEENELAEFIVSVAEKGFGKTRQQIKAIAEKCAHKKGALSKGRRITDGWYQRFMQRQAHLSLRRGDATAAVRMDSVSKEIMDNYFKLLKEVLDEHNILNDPSCIYNVDETGMPLEPRPPKVVTARGQKKVRVRTSGNKAQITVVVSVNATGNTIPPFVIFDAKNVNLDWTRGEVPGTSYAANSSGWIDSNLFKQWLSDHFLKHAVATRPLILLLDGHCSHYQPELIKCAQENNVILFCLPPHTTHETQPLDVSVFKPLKSNWQECCHEFIQQNPGRVVTKYQFSELFKQAWNMTMTPGNICAGFEKCGIYPFNPQAVKTDEEEGSTNFSEGATTNDVNGTGDPGKSVHLGDTNNSDENDPTEKINFTPEQMQLYQKRYDEGYDIADPQYLQWMEIYYPAAGSSSNDHCELTLAEEFSYIEPCTPVTILDSTAEESSDINTTQTTTPKCTPEPVTEALVCGKIQPSSSSVTASNTSNSGEENDLKYISKFLVQFVPTKTKVNSSQTSKRVSGAKILTSGECAAIIEERGKNKKKKEQEKEERKAMREEKKREKEEIAKKKAEQKQSKQNVNLQSKTQSRKRKATSKTDLALKKPQTRAEVCTVKNPGHIGEPSTSSSAYNTNECRVCFRTYEEDERECTGLDWVQCVCTRWIHDECISEVVIDDQGHELLCPFCVL